MFINADYKNWYLSYLAKQALKTACLEVYSKVLLVSEPNKYLTDYINEKNISYKLCANLENISLDEYSHVLILKPGFEYISSCVPQIKNIYSDFSTYALQKTPIDFIVNQFKNDMSFYDNYTIQKEIIVKEYIAHYINCCINGNSIRLFNKVEIETINRCNNTCSFCPVNHKYDTRKFSRMPTDLFEHIIQQLADLKYSGALALFSNNEPLLDDRLYAFAVYARKMLPNAYIYVYTNGILLTPIILLSLLEVIDYIHINNYNSIPVLNEPIKKIHSLLKEHEITENRVAIHLRNINETLSNRCGNSPNKPSGPMLTCSCILPFSQIVIRADGNVSLCCNDALGQTNIGSINKQDISNVWNNKIRHDFCIKLRQTRKNISTCQKCDFIFTPLHFEKIPDSFEKNKERFAND